MRRKLTCLLLAVLLAAAPLLGGAGTVRAASVSTEEMEALIEKQIRAFGDSIDKSNADDDAASALASHGMFKGGKKLSVGKSHALTATLFNSELLQAALTYTCSAAIQYMQPFVQTSITHMGGEIDWYGTSSGYCAYVYTSADSENIDFWLGSIKPYDGKLNTYDDTLDWMAAGTYFDLKMDCSKVSATEAVYKVTCTVSDRFDFATSSNSNFKNLISGIGAVLFKEFDWESTVSFELTVPYSCSHCSGMYRWTYDPENCIFTSDGSDGYTENGTTRHSYENSVGAFSYCYELDNPVRLYHDEPWVLEYDVKNPGTFVLAPLLHTSSSTTWLTLTNYKRDYLWMHNYVRTTVSDTIVKEYDLTSPSQKVKNYYGTPLDTLFTYNYKNVYTLRLENEVKADGSNMIYLTVHNADTGELLLDKAPMDDHWVNESWVNERVLKSKSDNYLNGKDLFINFIGNKTYRFSADHFELRIWENGKGNEGESYFASKVTKPTCTKQGYTTYTCSCCGYSYKADKVKAKGHSFGDWTTVTPATCTEPGEEHRSCNNCDHSETREIAATGHSHEAAITAPTCTEGGYTTFTCPCGDSYVGDETAALGHSFTDHICTLCGEREYIPGDVDLDGDVDVDDVLALLWNVLFPEEYPIEVNADFDSNGTTDVDDVLALLWYVLFPEEYPLK